MELVHWTSTDGVPLKGLLYKPENFDPTKKYPMISYFYEQLSQSLHIYVAPNGRNVINPTHYVSNGYLVFEPDIHYEIGYPGAERGEVDRTRRADAARPRLRRPQGASASRASRGAATRPRS